HKILHILMFITSFGEQNITYKCCSNFLIHLSPPMIEAVKNWLDEQALQNYRIYSEKFLQSNTSR
ncbi:hypothetical protein, partial [Acinetobacter pittii]|uniref:hypothetical protein n=1 Tax=Acinetobacter pittii TaxID=48296 RepID=UPI00355C1F1B